MFKYNYDWDALIKEQRESNMNMKEFCLEKNLPCHSFKSHKYASKLQISTNKTFLPVKAKMSEEVKFTINGNTICIDSSLDDKTLARILKAFIT